MKKSKAAEDLGVNPIFGNLKGARSHHAPDYAKNKDADVIPKGKKRAIPNEYWMADISRSAFPRGDDDLASTAFLPTPGKDRAQPHKKINETDH